MAFSRFWAFGTALRLRRYDSSSTVFSCRGSGSVVFLATWLARPITEPSIMVNRPKTINDMPTKVMSMVSPAISGLRINIYTAAATSAVGTRKNQLDSRVGREPKSNRNSWNRGRKSGTDEQCAGGKDNAAVGQLYAEYEHQHSYNQGYRPGENQITAFHIFPFMVCISTY